MIDLSKYRQKFLGECMGVGLYARGKEDPHVCVHILVEDDENWFISTNGCSSYWLPELRHQLEAAHVWMEQNCEPDPSGFGWRFK